MASKKIPAGNLPNYEWRVTTARSPQARRLFKFPVGDSDGNDCDDDNGFWFFLKMDELLLPLHDVSLSLTIPAVSTRAAYSFQ